MDKDFKFKGCLLFDGGKFFHRYLTLKHHTGDAQFFRHSKSGGVVESHLGGAVQVQFRKIAPCHADHPQILHQQGIGLQAVEQRQLLEGGGKLLFLEQSVECHINLFAVTVKMFNDLSHGIGGKVFAPLPGVEPGKSGIYGISTGIKSCQSS